MPAIFLNFQLTFEFGGVILYLLFDFLKTDVVGLSIFGKFITQIFKNLPCKILVSILKVISLGYPVQIILIAFIISLKFPVK